MQIVYAQEEAPQTYSKSVFLVGPTPRSADVSSWRPKMIDELAKQGYDGVVFSPEPRNGEWANNYQNQVEWEKRHLEMADLILAWVPRQLPAMPAFTTNVEFGRYVTSGKLLYGRPFWASKARYLDWMYEDLVKEEPHFEMESLVTAALQRLGEGAERSEGERYVPLHLWKMPAFQSWYASQRAAGNRLDDARVLWTFMIPRRNIVFSYSVWAKVWIEREQRHKENEFVLARNDIACVLAYQQTFTGKLLDTKVVLIKEFRTPVRNSDGFVYELPGGSSFKPDKDPLQTAADELREETGIDLPADRFFEVQSRQLAATFSSHHAKLYAVELSSVEMAAAEKLSEEGATFGVEEDSEKTYVCVKTLRECLLTDLLDFSMLGMIVNGLRHE